MNFVRSAIRDLHRRTLKKRAYENYTKKSGKKIIVFSPHPDDETLGCGGTIIKQIKDGYSVKIVFMTDGSNSHSHILSPDKLAKIRCLEAISATNKLNISHDNLIFLDYPDGDLLNRIPEAVSKVQLIIKEQQPDEVFIPAKKEPIITDHRITNEIVSLALKSYNKNLVVTEYPIWLYCHYPWVEFKVTNLKGTLYTLKQSIFSWLYLMIYFRNSIYVGDVLEIKQSALQEHKSQLTRLCSNTNWETLNDISNGSFVECFFQEYEFFYRYNSLRT